MFLAHGPISYILNEKIQQKDISKLNKGEQFGVALLSFFFGILPDFDMFVLSVTSIPAFQHHQVFSHSLLFWVLIYFSVGILFSILRRVLNNDTRKIFNMKFLTIVQRALLVGAVSHLLADILFSYSQILLPIQKEVTLLGSIISKNYFSLLFFSVSMAVEILIILLFLLMIYVRYIKQNIYIKYLLYVLLSLSGTFVLLSIYMNVNTYNNTTHMENGLIVYDADYDGIVDYKDSDTNNDGRDNIEDVNRDILANDVVDILNGKYLTSSTRDIPYLFGSLNSYRLISQAYFNQNKAIEPVLGTFAQKEYNIRGYDIDIEYSKLLYEYINQNYQLRDYDINVERGNIFFVIDAKGDVLNMGIVLENDNVGIVLDSDKRTALHTYKEILDYYNGYTIKVQE